MSKVSLHNRKLPFAWHLWDQRMVGPEEVNNGLKCQCVCKACGATLVSKQGPKRAWHFAHAVRADCRSGIETAIHWMAKQMIVERREVFSPGRSLSRSVSGAQGVWKKTIRADVHLARVISLDDCVPEKTMGSRDDTGWRRPDVMAIFDGAPIAIEICNTHAVDDEKRQWLEAKNVSVIEIQVTDLVGLPIENIRHALERRLFAPSHFANWLVHAGDQEALRRLDRSELELRESKAADEARLLAELARQAAEEKRRQEAYDHVRELEIRCIRFGPAVTVRIARSKTRCSLEWIGSPPDNVYQAILAIARALGGWYNNRAYRWEFCPPSGIDMLFARMLDWAHSFAGRAVAYDSGVLPLHENTVPRVVPRFADPAEQEIFEERAGIMEFEGNLTRADAEQRAFEEMSACHVVTATLGKVAASQSSM